MTSAPPTTSGPSRCPNCNSPLSPDLKFCETCGAKIDASPVCGNCGAPLSDGVKFCENCGAPRSVPASPQPAPEPVAAPVAEEITPITPPGTPVVPEKDPGIATETAAPAAEPESEERITAPAPVRPAPAATGPKTSPSKTILIAGLAGAIILVAAIVFVVLPILSGSGGGIAIPGIPGTSPTSSGSTAVTTTPAASITPGPTQTLPASLTLQFQVDKDSVNGDVTVSVTGPSRNIIKRVEVRVTHPDGQVSTGEIVPGQKSDEVTVSGTRNSERVEVTMVSYSGDRYKVIDRIVLFGVRMK
jgi:hypothetical protein